MSQAVAARPDVQEMVVVHRVFRREFRLAPQIVRAVAAGDAARAQVVGAHVTEMSEMLHHHHTGEDELVWPKLDERAELSRDLVGRMEEQHERVGALLATVGELLPQWTASADAALRDRLADTLQDLSTQLDAHLDEEEREVLPLIREHLTAEEWAEIGQRGMAGIAKPRLLVVLAHILEDASDDERAQFLHRIPPPARLAYKVIGRRKHGREVAVLRSGVVPQQRQG